MKNFHLPNKLMKQMTLVTLFGILAGCATTYIDERARSPHFMDSQFTNGIKPDKTGWDFFKMRMTTDWADWPEWIESTYGPAPLNKVVGNEIRVTHINHATVLIQTGGYNILTDPIYSKSCSPVLFFNLDRVQNPGVRFDDLPKIDVVIISHDHYDHLDLPTIERLVARDNPRIYLGLGVGERLSSMDNVKELDWWEEIKVGEGFTLTFVPVQHFSGRTLFDRFSTLWGGFVLEISKSKIYFGGDSGYANHYKETFEKFGPMDLSLLPVGHYAPFDFMGYAHMDPKQAVQAHLDLRSRKSIGIHHSTFPLTAEPIEEPVELLKKESMNAGLKEGEFTTVEFGLPVILSGK